MTSKYELLLAKEREYQNKMKAIAYRDSLIDSITESNLSKHTRHVLERMIERHYDFFFEEGQ